MDIDKIIERADAAYQSGVKPGRGLMGVRSNSVGEIVRIAEDRSCCLLGAALIGLRDLGEPRNLRTYNASTPLGLTLHQINVIVDAFDSATRVSEDPKDDELAAKVIAFRQKWIR